MLSRFHFTRLFKEETGLTPGRFLAAVRIHEAERLIEKTSMSITEVSYAVGYNSLGSFTNYFTASVGVSPSRFRRLARDGGPASNGARPVAGTGHGRRNRQSARGPWERACSWVPSPRPSSSTRVSPRPSSTYRAAVLLHPEERPRGELAPARSSGGRQPRARPDDPPDPARRGA
ncbi:helix-turn-helix domain-containing protein [Streptomyces sp. NBC_00151]|uniref:helix-turn-helix domain-containing protein n=1 Tax=Streptomyces sp. NBC_00151 TaxID=2975669 RepID=UPI003FA379C2